MREWYDDTDWIMFFPLVGSTLPASASAPTMSFEGNSSSTRNDAPPTGTPPNYRRSPDLYSRFPRRSRSPINHHRSRHKRHWSPTKRRSRSPVKRARGKTPPSAYSVVRRSVSTVICYYWHKSQKKKFHVFLRTFPVLLVFRWATNSIISQPFYLFQNGC